jgi:hypothetical protein
MPVQVEFKSERNGKTRTMRFVVARRGIKAVLMLNRKELEVFLETIPLNVVRRKVPTQIDVFQVVEDASQPGGVRLMKSDLRRTERGPENVEYWVGNDLVIWD